MNTTDRKSEHDPEAEDEIVQNAFHGTCAKIKWFDLKRFNRFIIAQKRRGINLTIYEVMGLVDQNPAYAHYRPAFELMAQHLSEETKAREDEKPAPSPYGSVDDETVEEA